MTTIKKIKKGEKIFFLFEGEIFEEKINDRYYMIDRLYIETDSFNVKIDRKSLNQGKVELERVVVSSRREWLEGYQIQSCTNCLNSIYTNEGNITYYYKCKITCESMLDHQAECYCCENYKKKESK